MTTINHEVNEMIALEEDIHRALSTLEAFIGMFMGGRCEGKYDPASNLRQDLHDGEGCVVCDAWATFDHLKRQTDSAKELGI